MGKVECFAKVSVEETDNGFEVVSDNEENVVIMTEKQLATAMNLIEVPFIRLEKAVDEDIFLKILKEIQEDCRFKKYLKDIVFKFYDKGDC